MLLDDPGIVSLTTELCRFPSGVVAEGNEPLFARIAKELPIRIRRYASGLNFNGWTVPQLWQVEKATIYKDGRLVFDGQSHTLAVASYSKSFSGELEWEALKPHLVTNPAAPKAHMFHCMWQYRPWEVDWAFCIPFEIYDTLGHGRYMIDLRTSYRTGEMLVGEYDKAGQSAHTIVFNSNTCHPHQANDSFAGVALLIRLFQWLQTQDTYYTYRLVLAPEHLGSVFYLHDKKKDELRRLVSGVYMEMPGTKGPIKLASSFMGNQPIDQVLRHAARHYSRAAVTVPWRCGAGNDETVWEAPGYEVPFVEVTRCIETFAPYPEYHSSLDTADRLDLQQINELFQVFQKAVFILEHDARLMRQFDGLICLSNPDYDLYLERPDPTVTKHLEEDSEKWGHLLDCLFRYMDGSCTILEIADKHDLTFEPLYRYLLRFQEKGLIRLVRAPIERVPISGAGRGQMEDIER